MLAYIVHVLTKVESFVNRAIVSRTVASCYNNCVLAIVRDSEMVA